MDRVCRSDLKHDTTGLAQARHDVSYLGRHLGPAAQPARTVPYLARHAPYGTTDDEGGGRSTVPMTTRNGGGGGGGGARRRRHAAGWLYLDELHGPVDLSG